MEIASGPAGLDSVQVIGIRPTESSASPANACWLRSSCPGAHGSGHSLTIRTVMEAPLAARTSTYAPHAVAVS